MTAPLQGRPTHTARRVFLAACVLIIAVHAGVIAQRRARHPGDFDVSREFGRRFLAGEHLYAGSLHYPYLPVAALYFAPLASTHSELAFVLRYAAGLGCLWLTLHLLYTMVARQVDPRAAPHLESRRFEITVITLILASHYIIRDLDDGGPHLILLAMLVGGAASLQRERTVLAGALFGLATALKAPAGLVLPYLVLKRRWRVACSTAVFTAIWMLLPMLWMGPASWCAHHGEWAAAASGSLLANRIAVAEASERRIQNQALRPVVSRYLTERNDPPSMAATHLPLIPLRRTVADLLAAGAALVLIAALAWRWRHPPRGCDDSQLLIELSGVFILALLLSPATWVQHLVFVVPAIYLIVAQHRAVTPLPAAAVAAMMLYALLALLLNREVLGKWLYLVLLEHGLHTACMLLVLAVVATYWPTAADARLADAPEIASGSRGGE